VRSAARRQADPSCAESLAKLEAKWNRFRPLEAARSRTPESVLRRAERCVIAVVKPAVYSSSELAGSSDRGGDHLTSRMGFEYCCLLLVPCDCPRGDRGHFAEILCCLWSCHVYVPRGRRRAADPFGFTCASEAEKGPNMGQPPTTHPHRRPSHSTCSSPIVTRDDWGRQ
jgi:hypothetical protein